MAEGGRRFSVRGLVRAFHRDAGNLAVGLTVVYALSGIAVNHIADWNPNFTDYQKTHELGGPLKGDDEAVASMVMGKLGIAGKPGDVYRATPSELEVTLDRRTLHINTETGKVLDEGEKPRFLLRVVNWLHLNRGKKAWTYVADGYAGGLLVAGVLGPIHVAWEKGASGSRRYLCAFGSRHSDRIRNALRRPLKRASHKM